MQSVYQIPGELLEAHVVRLRRSQYIQSNEGFLHACLFITGLRVATHHFRDSSEAQSGSESLTNLTVAPSHCIDDGLEVIARRALKLLMHKAHSQGVKGTIKIVYPDGAPNPNLLAVIFSFTNLFLDDVPQTVLDWISRGDPTENKIRLSCAMGVLSLWSSDTMRFIHALMGAPVHFSDDFIAEAMYEFDTHTKV